MFNLILAADKPPQGAALIFAIIMGSAFAIVMLILMLRERSKRPFRVLDSLNSSSALVPMAGGMVTVRVPAGLVPFAKPDGEVALVPQQACGITLHVHASMIGADGEEGDSVRRWVDNWAADNDAEVVERTDRVVARAAKQVEASGKDFDVRLWMVGIGPVVVSILAEIDLREAKKGRVEAVLRKLPTLIDGIKANIERKMFGTEAQRGEYLTYDADGLIVNGIDRQDQDFLDRWEARAGDILRKYLAAERLIRITPSVLDWGLLLWQRDADPDKPSYEDVMKAFGVAFGNHCVRALEMRWGVTEVDGARNFVLRRAQSQFLLFPLRPPETLSDTCDRYTPLFAIASIASSPPPKGRQVA